MKTHKIIFYLKKSKTNMKTGEAPIYLRITVEGERAEIATAKSIKPENWDSKTNRPKGRKPEAQTLNIALAQLENKVNQAANSLVLSGIEITSEAIKAYVKGESKSKHTLMEAIELHNKKFKELVGEKYEESTYDKYVITHKKVSAFLQYNLKKDIALDDLDLLFIEDFDAYLRTHDGNKHNTASKYTKNLKKIVNDSVNWKWLNINPFNAFHCTYTKPNKPHLVMSEIKAIEEKTFATSRLDLVRDAFIFSVYTGLAFADLARLTYNDITKGNDGKDWIIINRKKTGTRAPIPLLPKANELIKKYRENPICASTNKVLPLFSHQKTNEYLKEIADVCGITKHITFHIARHTFASFALASGVPLETISKTMGHTTIAMTQQYAKVNDEKISHDFDDFEKKLNSKSLKIMQEEKLLQFS